MLTDSSAWDGNPRLPATWRVLTAMLHHAALSQAELREATGLSHPIIVQQVARLRRAGLITFGQPIVGQPGRPPVPMSFNWRFRRLLTLDVHRAGITVQATDLAGSPLGDAQTVSLDAWTRDSLTSTLISLIRNTLMQSGTPWAAVGICLPAIIASDAHTILEWADNPEWAGANLGAALQEACGCPVLLESAGNVLASMVATANPAQVASVVAVTMRHLPALHAGVLLNGRLVRGTHGRAGNITQLPASGADWSGRLSDLFTPTAAGPRLQGVQALGCLLATLAMVLDAGHTVVQGDAHWSDQETTALTAALESNGFTGANHQLVLLNDTPAQTVDLLLGLARAMSRKLLDLQSGQLTTWTEEALAAMGTR